MFAQPFTTLEHRVALEVLDANWRQHLADLDSEYERVSSPKWSGTDRLSDLQLGADRRYAELLDRANRETTGYLFNLEVQ